jgi:hypothetical protein
LKLESVSNIHEIVKIRKLYVWQYWNAYS